MTFLIAAAGTGGHVFPGLAVGEALLNLGVDRSDVAYVGGDRLEATVYPEEGFRFVEVELAGLKRSLALQNLRIPGVVRRARTAIAGEIEQSSVRAVLGMGGYVTIPAALAARKQRVPFFNAEQNAEAGLANRVTARWARQSFVSFPDTGGLPSATWVGNPVREPFWDFDRDELRDAALDHYGLSGDLAVVGVFGGSLGAGVINEAVVDMVTSWSGDPVAVVHLTGDAHLVALSGIEPGDRVTWVRMGFEKRMDLFYAASDLVVARAGGAVAELTATATPSVLVPGQFGSGGHQEGNARALQRAGAAEVVPQTRLDRLAGTVVELVSNADRRVTMARAAADISKPDAARTIARAMIEAAS
ncbi:MAG TPA: UDP-N-acetylglucosamine--N-acetylmuramyl-(pentapeptide) pyrophosphoryl-undecaprenol N-acetylglucosamine transferase [Acidimicrobiia bacterium]